MLRLSLFESLWGLIFRGRVQEFAASVMVQEALLVFLGAVCVCVCVCVRGDGNKILLASWYLKLNLL